MFQSDFYAHRDEIIKIIGIGGGGCNAVNYMYEKEMKGVKFFICNTDAQCLEQASLENKIHIGPELTQGLGAGSNPEVGRQATLESEQYIRSVLEQNTKMLFITAGMGGGTGTGGAPIIAKVAKELGILTIGVVTTPFKFEGKKRIQQAQEGINSLKNYVDTLLIISNEKLKIMHQDLSMSNAFNKADDILLNSTKCITDVINIPGKINVDFADVCTVMKNGGVAIFGNAEAAGEERAAKAIKQAITSPLLDDNDISGAKWILLNISSPEDEYEITMHEIDTIQDILIQHVGEESNVILGTSYNTQFENQIGITLIATDFQKDVQATIEQSITGSHIKALRTNEEMTPQVEETQVQKVEITTPQVEETQVQKVEITTPQVEETQVQKVEITTPQVEETQVQKVEITTPQVEETQVQKVEITTPQVEEINLKLNDPNKSYENDYQQTKLSFESDIESNSDNSEQENIILSEELQDEILEQESAPKSINTSFAIKKPSQIYEEDTDNYLGEQPENKNETEKSMENDLNYFETTFESKKEEITEKESTIIEDEDGSSQKNELQPENNFITTYLPKESHNIVEDDHTPQTIDPIPSGKSHMQKESDTSGQDFGNPFLSSIQNELPDIQKENLDNDNTSLQSSKSLTEKNNIQNTKEKVPKEELSIEEKLNSFSLDPSQIESKVLNEQPSYLRNEAIKKFIEENHSSQINKDKMETSNYSVTNNSQKRNTTISALNQFLFGQKPD